VPSLMPKGSITKGLGERDARGSTNLSRMQRANQKCEFPCFLVTADHHSQEQDKHQNAEQHLERLPDVYPCKRRIAITRLCLFEAVLNPSHEFSSLFDVELIFREGQSQVVQSRGGFEEIERVSGDDSSNAVSACTPGCRPFRRLRRAR
jgi:hypothetical protein